MSIELQNIDANCNNCKHMERDMKTYTKWMRWHRALSYIDFRRDRKKAFEDALNQPTEKARQSMLFHAKKMKFIFEKKGLLNYGTCTKFNQPVCFIPDTCQIDTQKCFENRKQCT